MHRACNILMISTLLALAASPVAALSLDSARARPADTFLTFPAWYSGWDSNDSLQCLGASHALHPALEFSPRGFLGYRFWIAYTPICISESDENPHIAVSNDGRRWHEFATDRNVLTNPVFDRFFCSAVHLSDPDLLLHRDSVLYLLFRATWEIAGIDSNAIYISATTDGLTWSPPLKILSDGLLAQPKQSAFLSPSITTDSDSLFHLYVVEPRCSGITLLDTSRILEYRSAHPFGPWSFHDTCTVVLPSDSLKIWHLEVLTDPLSRHTALLNLVPNSSLNGGDSGQLFLADFDTETDIWDVAINPVLSWETDPSAWYGRRIYRASGVWFTTTEDTLIWLYYSAYAHRINAGGTGTGWQTGLTWITFDSIPAPLCLAPGLQGETNLTHVVNPNPTFHWLSADPSSHRFPEETAFELRCDQDSTGAVLWSGGLVDASCHFSPENLELESGVDYNVRIRSRHGDIWSPWAGQPFRTNAAPTAPTCLYPPHDHVRPLYDLQPVFTWDSSSDPDPGDLVRYHFSLQADTTAITSTSLLSDSTTLTLPDSLAPFTRYHWTVTACDTFNACSPPADLASFMTFLPGDLTADFKLSITDLTTLIDILFRGGSLSIPLIGAELDGHCGLTVADVTVLIAYLFRGGVPPFPGCS